MVKLTQTKKRGIIFFIALLVMTMGIGMMSGCSENASKRQAEGNKEGVYYEIYVGSFADSNEDGIGDFNGLISKLDYLNDGKDNTDNDLGVTGIWLMPIYPSTSYHKYDILDFYNVDPQYGTLEEFDRLIEECHKRGISVILDYIANCSSNSHPWFLDAVNPESPYRDYYFWYDENNSDYDLNATWQGNNVWREVNGQKYIGIYSELMPDFNLKNPKVREELKSIAKFWLDRGIDGFRLDSVPHIISASEVLANEDYIALGVEWWQEFADYCKTIKSDVYTVGEVWDETYLRSRFIKPLQSAFHFTLGDKIASLVKAGVNKNDAFGSILEKNYTSYSEVRKDYIDAPFLTNHDQPRSGNQFINKPESLKMAASLYLTLEGLPFIYYGEEIGMLGTNPHEEIRTPLLWGEGDNAQTSWFTSSYNKNTIDIATQLKDENSLLKHYQRLIKVRTAYEALFKGSFSEMSGTEAIVAYGLVTDKQEAVILHNISKATADFVLADKGYDIVFSTDKSAAKIDGATVNINSMNTVILIKNK